MKTLKTKLLLAFFISGFFLFGLAGVSEAANYYVSTTTPVVDGDIFCDGKCTSGDTIIIKGGARGNLQFKDFDGNGSYIPIINEGGAASKVEITSNAVLGFGILSLEKCKYVDLRGNNNSSYDYGIKVIADGSPSRPHSVWVYRESDHIKLGYLEITSDPAVTGSGIHVGDTSLTTAWTFSTFEIHHNYIHDTQYAGMYLGLNDPHLPENNDPYLGTFSIHDNILEDMGAYGITYKGVNGPDNYIYNNIIQGSSGGQSTGLNQGTLPPFAFHGIGTQMHYNDHYVEIYNNRIEKTWGEGIRISGKGHLAYDNLILGCGIGDDPDYGHGIRVQKFAEDVYINDNIIIQPKRYAIYSESDWQIPISVYLNRNLIGDYGLGESTGPNLFEGIGADANWYESNVADFNFNAWSDDN
ncbi:right-handed parallel beta-helix repeat-containing protein, partial [Candidatus Parcubacteria bacterium]|nr:right-handed parallel beta-helix repeat-containing protein [Candidatus Parcubacteria bacterium]